MKHFITPEQAKKLTRNYRHKREKMVNEEFRGRKTMPLCETFDRAAFDALLQQPGCTSIRIYLGMDEEKQVKLIAVGVNEKGEDILPDVAQTADFTAATGLILEDGARCPDHCPADSFLNSDDL